MRAFKACIAVYTSCICCCSAGPLQLVHPSWPRLTHEHVHILGVHSCMLTQALAAGTHAANTVSLIKVQVRPAAAQQPAHNAETQADINTLRTARAPPNGSDQNRVERCHLIAVCGICPGSRLAYCCLWLQKTALAKATATQQVSGMYPAHSVQRPSIWVALPSVDC